MKLIITARNMTVTPAIEERIEKKTQRMSKYLLPDVELQIKLQKGKDGVRTAEMTVPMGNGVLLRSEASAEGNLFMAIDQALARLERQIHKHRDRLGKKLRDDAFSIEPEYIEAEEENDPRTIVKRKTFPVRPMSEEDAIIQMEMLGHSFFAFVNIETERTNILYLRKDGTLGLLEPEA